MRLKRRDHKALLLTLQRIFSIRYIRILDNSQPLNTSWIPRNQKVEFGRASTSIDILLNFTAGDLSDIPSTFEQLKAFAVSTHVHRRAGGE